KVRRGQHRLARGRASEGQEENMPQHSLMRWAVVAVAAILLRVPAHAKPPQEQAAAAPPPQTLTTEMAFGIFQKNCMTCHGNPVAAQRGPEISTLLRMSA